MSNDSAIGRGQRQGLLGIAVITTAALVGLAAVVAPRPAPSGANVSHPDHVVKGGTFVDAGISDAVTLQPVLVTDTASRMLTELHYNAPLIRLNPDTLDFEARYGTAERWTMSPDGLEFTFTLKPDLTWSDGTALTSADYRFTVERYLDPKVPYSGRVQWALVDQVAAPDPRTLVFRMKEPFCPILSVIADLNPIPKHVFEGQDLNETALNQKPQVGSGPWLLQEWIKDDHAVFIANDRFYLGRPNLDKYVYRVVKDQTVGLSLLKNAEVDRWSGIRAEDYQEANAIPTAQTYAFYNVKPAWIYIGMNTRADALQDTRVREALAHVVDRQTLIDRVRFGKARPINSMLTPSSWAFDQTVAAKPLDLNRARQLLSDASWLPPTNDPGGIRSKDGKPLRLRIFYNSGNKEREIIATVFQQSARQVGVDVEVIVEEFNAFVNRISRTRDLELYVTGVVSGIDPNGTASSWRSDSASNATGFGDPRVDTLFRDAATVRGCGQADRQVLYAEIQQRVAAATPMIFLWENQSIDSVGRRVAVNPVSKLGYDYRKWEWYARN